MELTADAAVLQQFRDFARHVGLPLNEFLPADLKRLVRRIGETSRAPANEIIDLLQLSAEASRRSDVGVVFADWLNLRRFGPASLLWEHCGNFGETMRVLRRFAKLENPAVTLDIVQTRREVAIVLSLLISSRYGASQFMESVLALTTRIGRLMLGESWNPVRIEFQHGDPDNLKFKRRFFRCPIDNRSSRYALVCMPADMVTPFAGGNPHMLAFLENHLETVKRQWPDDFLDQVRQAVAARLAGGHATLAEIAALLVVSERTLQRKLYGRKTSFAGVLEDVRCRRAEEYFLSESRPNLASLAYLLGYSDTSTIARFLRDKLGRSSRELRQRSRTRPRTDGAR